VQRPEAVVEIRFLYGLMHPLDAPGRHSRPKAVIGHRGASAYAPEHTLHSYDLALDQGADAVEQDLHVTKDGVLVCLHDRSLERTTDVRDVFPDRGRDVIIGERITRHWFVHDFTVDEIKQLDAGSWFSAEFAGLRVPTFQEVVDAVGSRGSLCTELKDPEVYETLGVDILSLLATTLRRNDIDRPRPGTPLLTLQCFHEPTVRRAAATFDRRLPLVLLIEPADADRWPDRASVEAVVDFATGLGPGKAMLEARPEIVRWAHQAGLRVTPWTFRATAPGRFESVRAEMAYYLSVLDVDAVITDNPDQFPVGLRDWRLEAGG
jgi:glycerophosphoryl diester phosphodiesterase